MSKEEQARVRDELLQSLYRGVLRCELAGGAGPRGATAKTNFDALAAGVCANLMPEDLLLLPARGAESFRLLRGGAFKGSWGVREQDAGLLALPRETPSAVAFTLGAAAALARGSFGSLHKGRAGGLVCVLVPAPSGRKAAEGKSRWPQDWAAAAGYAARLGLPLLLLSGGVARKASAGQTREPASACPSIQVDAGDALAGYRVAYECAARARLERGGPSWIEAVPFTPMQAGEPSGALARLEAALRGRGAFSKAWRRQMERALVAGLSS